MRTAVTDGPLTRQSLCKTGAAESGSAQVAAVMVWRAGDVADLYGVDDSTVHRWERSGKLRTSRRDPGGFEYWLAHEVLEDLARPGTSVPNPSCIARSTSS